MRTISTLLFLLITGSAFAQPKNYIKGRVVQDGTNVPIPGASVFISNSTKGVVTGQDGSFDLQDVPTGTHELVISSIGYSTVVHAYKGDDLPLYLNVNMKRRASELATVVVEPDVADGWRRWGKFFMENFIGTNRDAQGCKLLNPEVLRFRFSKKTNTLTVIADEQLIIENNSLGYNLKYQLEEFNYGFSNRILRFTGYALFQDKMEQERLKKRLEDSRERAFAGSINHFMKSLYNNTLKEDGFEVRRMIKTPNEEKLRIRALMQERIKAQRETGNRNRNVNVLSGDSADYYNRILQQPNEFETVHPALLTADSLVRAGQNPDEKILFFKDWLYVVYKKEFEEEEYVRQQMQPKGRAHSQRSSVVLPNLEPITINKFGQYSPLYEFILYGYWAWSEKIGSMLPLD